MMLGRLFEGSLGQFIAPDAKALEDEAKNKEIRKSFSLMEILAPDPNYYNDVESTTNMNKTQQNQKKDTTPAKPSSFSTPPLKTQSFESPPLNNISFENGTVDSIADANLVSPQDKLQHQVLSAARATAFALKSSTAIWEERKNFFTLCCSKKPLSEKQVKKMKKLLQKNHSLATSYSTEMGTLVPDGFTPLHAAVRAGNVEAATVLVNFEVPEKTEETNSSEKTSTTATDDVPQNPPKMKKLVSLQTTDLQGRQPLHIASKYGHTELVSLLRQCLKEELDGIDPTGLQAPIDLTGRTPLGWACASREKNAQKNRKTLEQELFSPGDASICGPFSPPLQRNSVRKSITESRNQSRRTHPKSTGKIQKYEENGGVSDLVEFGYAEMAGWRVEMEDALCCHYPVLLGDDDENAAKEENDRQVEEIGLFGVFDGHGDGGKVSSFIADHLLQTLQKEWVEYDKNEDENKESKTAEGESMSKEEVVLINVCCELDELLYEKNVHQHGGSTGVFALLKDKEIIVANVGDSRAILITGEEDAQSPTQKTTEEKQNTTPSSPSYPISVIPLSEDHKPNLPAEKERIEKAGMKVISESFQNIVLHKIQLPGPSNTKIALSRAFGDFDFKSNPDLALEEQALTCVPEVATYRRNTKDKLLVLACDGIWDVMSNDEVGQFVYSKWAEGEKILAKIGDELLSECLTRGSRDNMTVLIVRVYLDPVKERLNFEQ